MIGWDDRGRWRDTAADCEGAVTDAPTPFVYDTILSKPEIKIIHKSKADNFGTFSVYLHIVSHMVSYPGYINKHT